MYKKDMSIVIADDHPMLLKGLHDELTAFGYNVIGSAINGMKALELILTNEPDLALLDIDMPMLTGFEVVKTAIEKGCKTKFIMLSFHKETEYVMQAKALQIHGYLLKEDSFMEVEKCMDAVLKGEQYFSPSFESNSIINASEEIKSLKLLTPSEITILKLAARRASNNEIAETLSVSIRTIEKHRSNIISKLRIDNGNNALTSWALTNKNIILHL
jgi:DNA-binding NarL/FixJ family response regulator